MRGIVRALGVGVASLALLAGCGGIQHSLHGMETTTCTKFRYRIEGAKQEDNREAVDATRALIERMDREGWELVSFMEGGTDELLFAFRKPC